MIARLRRIVLTALVLALFALGAGGYLLLGYRAYGERRTLVTAATQRVNDDVRRLEAVAAKLGEFQERLVGLESRLELLKPVVPEIPKGGIDRTLQADAEQFQRLARSAGLQAVEVSTESSSAADVAELRFQLSFEGSRDQVARFAADLAKRPRLVHVDDVFLPGRKGTMRVRAFAIVDRPTLPGRDDCSPLDDRYKAPWPFSTLAEQRELQAACLRRRELGEIMKKVEAFQAKERLLRERTALVDSIRALPVAAIETEYTPSRLRADELRVVALEPEAPGFVARVQAPNDRPVVLRPGDALVDAAIVSIGSDHLIAEWRVSVSKKPVKRLLRFSPAQSPPRISLGADTTRMTSPLLSRMVAGTPRPFAEDAPDYYAWLEKRNGAGVTRDNNAAPALDRALAGLKDAGQTFFDEMAHRREIWRVLSQPWLEQDCPACAERLEANQGPLAAIAEAVRRPRHFETAQPWGRASATRIPQLLRIRHAANALTGRGMLRIARGDLKGASEDALAVHRLAALLSQEPSLMENLIAVAVRGIGAPLLPLIAAQPSHSRQDALTLLQQVEGLQPLSIVADAVDHYERFHALDQILVIRSIAAARGPGAMSIQLEPVWRLQVGETLELDPIIYLIPTALIDWEEALRLTNRRFDALVAIARAPNLSDRRRARAEVLALAKQHEDRQRAVLGKLRGAENKPSNPDDVARAAGRLAAVPAGRAELAELFVSQEPLGSKDNPTGYAIAWNESEAVFRLTVNALALAVHRDDKGELPETLEALGLPDRFRPREPTPGYVMNYARAGPSGFAVTAVPEENKLSGNRGFCTDATGMVRFTTDGTAPRIVNGVCDPEAALLR